MKTNKLMKMACLVLALMMVALTSFAMAEDAGNAPENPVVILAGNPTTGYSWMAQAEDETIVTVSEGEFAQDEAEEGATGVGGYYRFEIAGAAEGYTTVTFVYARSWEDEAPVYKLVYDISVDSDLNATVVSTTFITEA